MIIDEEFIKRMEKLHEENPIRELEIRLNFTIYALKRVNEDVKKLEERLKQVEEQIQKL